LLCIFLCAIVRADEAVFSIWNNSPDEIYVEGIYSKAPKDLVSCLENGKAVPAEWPTIACTHYLVLIRDRKVSLFEMHVWGRKAVAVPCTFKIEKGTISEIIPIRAFAGFVIPPEIYDFRSITIFECGDLEPKNMAGNVTPEKDPAKENPHRKESANGMTSSHMTSSQTNSPQPANGKPSPPGKGESPDNSRSAPRQPPEGPPPAKPGSAR
jgi:hypothetical protein